MVPASSGPWAAVGLVSRRARHAARNVRGWARYLESLWSVTMTRPDDAALLWHILLSKLGQGLSARWLSRMGLQSVPRPARRAAWAAAWLAFVLLVQLYVYRHTANGLRLDGIPRAALAASFMLTAFSLAAEYVGVRLLRKSWPDRLRSCNALWFAASAAAAFLYAAGDLIRRGLGRDGLREPLTLATILCVAALTAFIVYDRKGKRYG